MFISGFLVSIILKLLNKYCGRQISYCLGAAVALVGSLLVLCLNWDGPDSVFLKGYAIYGVAILLGEWDRHISTILLNMTLI
jgi:hypothetical protein